MQHTPRDWGNGLGLGRARRESSTVTPLQQFSITRTACEHCLITGQGCLIFLRRRLHRHLHVAHPALSAIVRCHLRPCGSIGQATRVKGQQQASHKGKRAAAGKSSEWEEGVQGKNMQGWVLLVFHVLLKPTNLLDCL